MSVPVQVTVVTPAGKLAGALQLTLATPQLSETTGVPRSMLLSEAVVHAPAVEMKMSGGQIMLGGSLSITVTVKLAEAVLLWMSVTVTLTMVWPTGKA